MHERGPLFLTNIGSPQGDGASALFFIIYLAISLLLRIKREQLKQSEHSYSKPHINTQELLPIHLKDHTYAAPANNTFTIDQQYADDIGWASTGSHIIDNIEREIPPILAERNLLVNETKTERYKVTRNGSEQWKCCKYLGSLLGTEEDITRRRNLTNNAFSNLKVVFQDRQISTEVKLRMFTALLESIFLYNCELWSLTKALEDKVDIFQRQLLRRILNIHWTPEHPELWLSNSDLYELTKQRPWSKTIAQRRIRFFGHVCRLNENAPAKLALEECMRHTKKCQGRPKTTLLGIISKQLKDLGIANFETAIILAHMRPLWRYYTDLAAMS